MMSFIALIGNYQVSEEWMNHFVPPGRCLNESLMHAVSSSVLNTIIPNEFRYEPDYLCSLLGFTATVSYLTLLYITFFLTLLRTLNIIETIEIPCIGTYKNA